MQHGAKLISRGLHMLKVVRHLRANVIAYAALFVALGGTSYAATSLPKNSVGSKQIQTGAVHASDIASNAVTSAKVKNGVLRAADFRASDLASLKGATGAKGDKGDKGDPGQNFDANVNLGSGKSESGVYGVGGSATNGYMVTGIQFRLPLAAALDSSHVQFHQSATAFTAQCPAAGQAAAGYLCVYEDTQNNRSSPVVDKSTGFGGTDASGFMIFMNSTGTFAFSYGSWTVTAA
jgi:hypothetical protein